VESIKGKSNEQFSFSNVSVKNLNGNKVGGKKKIRELIKQKHFLFN
jgi:hypothetical protein